MSYALIRTQDARKSHPSPASQPSRFLGKAFSLLQLGSVGTHRGGTVREQQRTPRRLAIFTSPPPIFEIDRYCTSFLVRPFSKIVSTGGIGEFLIQYPNAFTCAKDTVSSATVLVRSRILVHNRRTVYMDMSFLLCVACLAQKSRSLAVLFPTRNSPACGAGCTYSSCTTKLTLRTWY